jgi:polyisoprenoid-binding protein YceI
MRVPDPEISVDKRAEIQHRMEGNAVLDVEHFPEISYRSTAITKTGDAHWEVHGDLNLHERSQPVVVVVSLAGGTIGVPHLSSRATSASVPYVSGWNR